MTDNSTQPKRTPQDRAKHENEINILRNNMSRLNAEAQKIRAAYPWKPEYDIELSRLIDLCKEKHRYTNFLAEFNKSKWFDSLRQGGIDAPAITITYISYAVSFINAHLEDLNSVLGDRGEQRTLFAEEEISPEEAKRWGHYLEKPADVRRLEILAQRALLEAAEDEINDWLMTDEIENAQLENFNTSFPSNYPRPLAKPVNCTFRNMLNDVPQLLGLEGHKSKKEITAVATLIKDKEKALMLDGLHGLDMFDKQVHNSIVALFESQGGKDCVVTPQMIYRAILADENARLPYQSADYTRIVGSMKKLFGYVLDLDAADKDKDGNPKYNRLIPRRYFGPLLMGEYFEAGKIKLNGQEVTGFFKIYRRPILDALACEINQRTIIPAALLKLSEKSATEYAIILKGEIAERIAWMKNAKARKKRVSCKIKYSELYVLVGIVEESTPVNMNRRQKVRDIVRKILKNHVKEKNINGYTEIQGRGRSIEGVEIKL